MKDKKKEKKEVIDFDKIDITTATENQIIESGIKKNTSEDKRNYFFMAIVFIFILIPPALRLFFPKPILEEERDIAYVNVRCFTSTNRHEQTWKFDSVYQGFYRDAKLEKVILEYSYNKNVDTAPSEVTFPELTLLNEIDNVGLLKEQTKNTTEENVEIFTNKYIMDFKNHKDVLESNTELKEYSYNSFNMEKIFKEKGYSCKTDSEIIKEMVKINEN